MTVSVDDQTTVSEETTSRDLQASPPAQKKSHLFQPGQSGNPSGRPKRSQEEKDALEAIRNLAPLAAEKVSALLKSEKTPAAVKVRLIEIIFDRTYGKPETSVRVSSVRETVAESRSYILSLVRQVREQSLIDVSGDADAALPGPDANAPDAFPAADTPAALPAETLAASQTDCPAIPAAVLTAVEPEKETST